MLHAGWELINCQSCIHQTPPNLIMCRDVLCKYPSRLRHVNQLRLHGARGLADCCRSIKSEGGGPSKTQTSARVCRNISCPHGCIRGSLDSNGVLDLYFGTLAASRRYAAWGRLADVSGYNKRGKSLSTSVKGHTSSARARGVYTNGYI